MLKFYTGWEENWNENAYKCIINIHNNFTKVTYISRLIVCSGVLVSLAHKISAQGDFLRWRITESDAKDDK